MARQGSNDSGRSQELEKLLNSWGAQPACTSSDVDKHAHSGYSSSSSAATNAQQKHDTRDYDAEVMIDELLASTWELEPVRRGSLAAAKLAGFAASAADRSTSFKQQTQSMNALQTVLAESIARLVKHRHAVSDRIASLEKENQKASSKFHDGLRSPELLLNMEDLEERFTKVSSTAVVIGDRLETLDRERTRVLETDELLEALLALNDPTTMHTKSSNRLVNTLMDPLQLHAAARVVKKMCVFSTELSSPAIAHAVREIERLSQSIETNLLQEFSDAQEREDLHAMQTCAASLIEYTDREKVADRYVWNVMKDRLATGLSFTTVSSLDPIQDLDVLFTRIRAICSEQFAVIASVFPRSTRNALRELLIERLFNDPAFGIFAYLDQFLTTRRQSSATDAHETSDSNNFMSDAADDAALAYVRLLCAAYEKTCDLTQAIEAMASNPPDAAKAAAAVTPLPTERARQTAKPQQSNDATAISVNNQDTDDARRSDRERMQTFLSLQLHSLFGGHRQRYFRTELDLVQRQCRAVVTRVQFPQLLTSKQKIAATKMKNASTPHTPTSASMVTTASIASPSSASSSNFERDNVLLSSVSPDAASLAFYESLLAIADDEAAPTTCEQVMSDAISRCEFVLKDSELRAELLTKLFASFIASFGDEYLGRVAAMASEVLQEPLLTTESARQFFHLVEALLRQIDNVEEQFDALLAPTLSDAPTQFTICYENKRRCLEKLERTIASGLQLVFAVVEKHVGAMLAAAQDKSDFIGSETNMSLASSRACRKVVDYLQPLVATICRVLVDENRDRFLITLCTTFKDVYLQHLQRFRFDPDGACMLLRDVNAYRQIFQAFRHAAIDDQFDVLHEVANLFALPPENLAGFVRDGKLARLTRSALLDIVKRRWDYKTSADKIGL